MGQDELGQGAGVCTEALLDEALFTRPVLVC